MNRLSSSDSSMPGCPGTIIKSQTVVAAAAHSSHIPFIKHEDNNEDNSNDDQPDDMQQQKYIAAQSSRGKASCITTASVSPQDLSSSDSMFGKDVGTGSKEAVDPDEKEKPIRRKRRVKGQKICGVCGDQAQSHNFGALSCETCKAFFRRNALKQKELQTCVFNGSCTITKETRRFCAPCRLKKCYSIGMDPDLILDSKEREERYRKRTLTTVCKRLALERVQVEHPSPPVACDLLAGPSPPSSQVDKEWRAEEEEGEKAQSVGTPVAEDLSKPNRDPEETDSSTTLPACIPSTSLACSSLGVRFQHARPDELPKDPDMYYRLADDELALLEKLTSEYRNIFWAETGSHSSMGGLQMSSLPVEKMMVAVDHLFRKFISFSKKVPEFHQLGEADKVALLKSTAMRLFCVRLGESYLLDRSAWHTGLGQVSAAEVAHLFKEQRILGKIVDFSRSFKSVVCQDTTLDALTHVLVLFDPRSPMLENRALVSRFKDRYLVLLKRHLEAHLSFMHVNRYLAEFMRILQDIDQLGQDLEDFFGDYSAHFFPLVVEFLNQ